MTHPTKADRERISMMRNHPDYVWIPEPENAPAYVVRYIREDGTVISRTYVTERSARKFAERLRGYGKRHVAVFHNSARPRWTKIG